MAEMTPEQFAAYMMERLHLHDDRTRNLLTRGFDKAIQAEREASYVRGYNEGWAAFRAQCAMNEGCELGAIERGELLTQEEILTKARNEQDPA